MAITIRKKVAVSTEPASSGTRPLKLMSIQETAIKGKVSIQTVRRLIKAGKLKSYRIGRQRRIDESDFLDCISFDGGEE